MLPAAAGGALAAAVATASATGWFLCNVEEELWFLSPVKGTRRACSLVKEDGVRSASAVLHNQIGTLERDTESIDKSCPP